jgi:small subunit ribosomal protein S17
MSENKEKKALEGVVISDSMDKTIVVKVDRVFRHPKIGKVMKVSKKYKVHDQKEEAKVGDKVKIILGRPMSKTKYMYLSQVVKHAS